jgi:hypothetical protein
MLYGKKQKTSAELSDFILQRIGIKVTILPHATQGWTATIYTSAKPTVNDRIELERLLKELRAVYSLKLTD